MSDKRSESTNWKKTLLISILILLVAVVVTVLIFRTEPTAKRTTATKETAMLVEVESVERGDYRPYIVATGTVQAAEDILLSPLVSGQIISRSPDFVPGGFVRKGQTLFQIDPADFQNELLLRKSELDQTMADLQLEKGRQDVARKDLQLMNERLRAEDSSLVLRKPQLKSIQARINAAQASVEQAELNLERSSVKAPFNAQILSRNANVGSLVSPGDVLGRLVGGDEYWVVVNVPLSKSKWLQLPKNNNEQGSIVRIRNRTAWPDSIYRTGYLYKRIGALEDETRLLRLLVSVPDPLAYGTDDPEVPPLIVGSFVETSIQAKEIKNVARMNRDHLRKDETAWVMIDGKLQIRELDIVLMDAKYAYVRGGLEEGDQLVTTNLSTVVEGSRLRTTDTDSVQQNGGTAPINGTEQ